MSDESVVEELDVFKAMVCEGGKPGHSFQTHIAKLCDERIADLKRQLAASQAECEKYHKAMLGAIVGWMASTLTPKDCEKIVAAQQKADAAK